jgi:hypothetical protein
LAAVALRYPYPQQGLRTVRLGLQLLLEIPEPPLPP